MLAPAPDAQQTTGVGYAGCMGERASAVPVTVCFVRSGGKLLLLRTAAWKDRFPGLWNGVGGHVRPGENVRAAALREIREEAGIEARELQLRAVIHETGLRGRDHLLFVFTTEVPQPIAGPPGQRRAEGELAWFERADLPWDELVPDLRALLPRILDAGEVLFGVQEFDGSDRPLRLEIG